MGVCAGVSCDFANYMAGSYMRPPQSPLPLGKDLKLLIAKVEGIEVGGRIVVMRMPCKHLPQVVAAFLISH